MDWLLLRGLLRDKRNYSDFPEVFAATVPGARVHLLDLPGIGSESERDSPCSVEEIMADLRRRWAPLRRGAQGPWGLFAASLGGMAALAWAAAHLDDFARVVVCNTSARDLGPFWRRFRPRNIARVPGFLLSSDPVGRERAVLRMTTSLIGAPELEVLARRHGAIAPPLARFRRTGVRQLWAGARFRLPGELALGRPPLLVLVSEGDTLVHPELSRILAARLKAPLRSHPRANHDLPLDDPQWVADQIRDWLAGAR